MKNKLSILFGFVFLISGLSISSGWAQTDQATKAQDSVLVEAPQPIPVQDLIRRIEEATAEIRVIQRKIRQKDDFRNLDTLFPETVKFLKEQKVATESFIKSNPNRQKINNQIKKWNGYNDRLTQWENNINEYQARNVKLIEGVKTNEQIWKLTYENRLDQEIPAEVSRQIEDTYRALTALREEIVKVNNDYLILASRINREKVEIAQQVDQLEKLKRSEIYDLFYLRHEPLWQSDMKGLFVKPDNSETGIRFDENITETGKYFVDNKDNVFRYLVFVLAVFLLMRWLRRVYAKYEFESNDKNLIYARDVIVKHGPAAMLFLFVLGFLMYSENRPTLLNDFLHLLALLLSVPLIRPFMRDSFKNLLYFVILVFIMDTIKTYIWFSSLQYRFYLMAEAIFIIILFYHYAIKKRFLVKFEDHYFGALLLRLAPVFQVIALISIASNVLGYTNLADLTLNISAKSGVYAVISYALMMVLGGLTSGVVHNHFESRTLDEALKKEVVQRKLLKVVRWFAGIFWVLTFLAFVDLLSPVTIYLTDVLTEPYTFGSLSITLGDILSFLVILTVSFFITSVISFLIDSGQFEWKFLDLPKGIPAAISLVIRYFIIATGIILALSSLGVDLSKFNLMAGALGLGIGFGLQNVISNFVSGLILVFERPILVGDTVEVNNLMGTVKRIGVRSSNISTFDGAEVVVPNTNLISNDLINWTLSSNLKRVEILIGTAYGTDPNEVLKLLMEVVNENDDILKNPGPQTLFSDFGDSSLNFRLRFWVPFEMGLQAKSDVSIAVYNKFKENDIEIPFPQRDIHIKTVPPDQKELEG